MNVCEFSQSGEISALRRELALKEGGERDGMAGAERAIAKLKEEMAEVRFRV